ncbi:MAG: glucosamine-6-phosphate deaminase [Candidatus Omnitrophota bacterium]
MRSYNYVSRLESIMLKKSGKEAVYPPVEKIKIIELPDFPSLGKITALRFLEWLQLNPEGVVSLPTGKTPEYFIKWTVHFLNNWNKKTVQAELSRWGINPNNKPRIDSFPFVQIDEFYPMNPSHKNSFAHYIEHYYFEEFGLDKKKALLIDAWKTGAPAGKNLEWVFPEDSVDLSLRFRPPVNWQEELQLKAITAADQFVVEYESKIERLGGIGFFLGGIGPDGHIGFNIRGTNPFSTTSLVPINYETAATAATDLGGIEISRHKVVITIGLKTIVQNTSTTAIIMAAGASKAKVVRDAVENDASVLYPATTLQGLGGARFYITQGASGFLTERQYRKVSAFSKIPNVWSEKILIDTAYNNKKTLSDLTTADLECTNMGNLILKNNKNISGLIDRTTVSLKKRIEAGMKNIDGLIFLHTAPHHDDIMLGYMPYIIHLVRSLKNQHYFATLTSGFSSVTNAYTLAQLKNLESYLEGDALARLIELNYFLDNKKINRSRDIYRYLDGLAANSTEMQREAEARRMLRDLMELTNKQRLPVLKREIKKIKNYLIYTYPGKKDPALIQKLKGMIREWEEELLWGHLGFNCEHIFHMRLGFYTGDIFTPQPEWKRDIEPVLRLLEKIEPDVVTVAMDPEGSGPDTHYKVLQAVAEALKAYLKKKKANKKIKVWGYRNVWYRFHPAEADIIVPVSMNSLAIIKESFNNCFASQRSASFPSYEYDGPFCDLAQKIMTEQYAVIKTCLGRDFFYNSLNPRLRATRALNLLRSMTPEEFFKEASSLKKVTESMA